MSQPRLGGLSSSQHAGSGAQSSGPAQRVWAGHRRGSAQVCGSLQASPNNSLVTVPYPGQDHTVPGQSWRSTKPCCIFNFLK